MSSRIFELYSDLQSGTNTNLNRSIRENLFEYSFQHWQILALPVLLKTFLICSHNTVEKRSRQTRESLTEEPSQEQEELKDILHELREDLDPEILNNNIYFFFSALLKVTALCPSWERDSDYLLSNYVKRNERPEKKTGIREAHISFSRIFSVINIHVLVNRDL